MFAKETIAVPLDVRIAPVVYVVALVPPRANANVPEVTCEAAIATAVLVTELTLP